MFLRDKGVDLYPWLGGMIGAKIFLAMDQSNQEVEACGRFTPLPKRVAMDFIKSSGWPCIMAQGMGTQKIFYVGDRGKMQ